MLISVIVTVYNVKSFLELCLSSLINQTYKKLEIILVDDGSDDGSGQLCDEYCIKNDNIRVIHQKNSGISSARNTGLNAATGDFISFIDSDDYLDPRFYEIMIEVAEEKKCDYVQCGIERFVKEKDIIPNSGISFQVSEVNQDELNKRFFNNNTIEYQSTTNKLYRKKYLQNSRFECGRIYEDALFTHYLLRKPTIVEIVDAKLYWYRVNPNSILHKRVTEKNFDISYLHQIMLGYFFDYDKKLYELALEDYLVCSEILYYNSIEGKSNDTVIKYFYELTLNLFEQVKKQNIKIGNEIVKFQLLKKSRRLYLLYKKIEHYYRSLKRKIKKCPFVK